MVGTKLESHELERMRRSMAMAPLTADAVGTLLVSHEQVTAELAEVREIVDRLGPAWAELRDVLDALNRKISTS